MEDRDILGNWEDHLLNTYLDTLDEVGGPENNPDEYEPDPDTMLGGHDNPYDAPRNQEGEDCFESALWDASPKPEPYEHEWS